MEGEAGGPRRAVTAALLGVALLAVFLLIGGALAWQERRSAPDGVVVYGVEESFTHVMAGLTTEARSRLTRADIRMILDWSIRYLQDPISRSNPEEPVVAGSVEAAQYVQDQSLAAGLAYDADLIFEVLALQADFLASIGAVGGAVMTDSDPSPMEE